MEKEKVKINSNTKRCSYKITRELKGRLPTDKNIVFLCIGSDRSTGDSFGPLVGTLLEERGVSKVLGTLEKPVHAENIRDIVNEISGKNYIIAIDAALGNCQNIGCFIIKDGGLKPGAGVNKELPIVGDLSIEFIVNVDDHDHMKYFVLQSTRLHIVYRGAKLLAEAIVSFWAKMDSAYNPKELIQIPKRLGFYMIRRQP